MKISTRSYTSQVLKHIRVETNDPEAGLVTLTLKAQIVEILKVTPRLVNFGKMLQNQTSVRELLCENQGKDPVRILSVEAKPPALLSLGEQEPFVLNPGQSRKIAMKLSSGSSEGYVHGYVMLKTDLEFLPEKVVRVRADVKKQQGIGQ
ncbi:MAG: hypothetical protein WDA72_09490 [Desulfomonilia bacterium]|mgnify:CR=1 FL=1|nr:hypothetical protein [Deltaproteobacteria bacterium]MDX9760508.1 hypothetical protein [Desulfomonilia bacterium]HPW68886.1 hypothetical protein [Deltaproteobacteria bacterium]